jgi:UDP-glucuronate 4-epimerase
LQILLTGCAGFIGSHLLDRLLEEGHDVIGVDDFNGYYDPKQKQNNIKQHRQNENFTLIKKDILNLSLKDLPPSIINHPSSIIHLAARAGVRASIKQPDMYEKVNVGGTLRLLYLAKRIKTKHFIFGSSSSVYGNNTPTPFKENAPCDQPISPYAATKRSAELMCYTYHHLYQLPITVFRFFTVYGPRNRPDMAAFKFVDAIANGKTITIYGKGTSRDYTYVGDIVDAFDKIVELSDSLFSKQFEIINLGNSSPVTLAKFVKTIEKAVGKKSIAKSGLLPPGDVKKTYADVRKAKKLLGWEPKTSLEDGLSSLWKWYKARR